MAYFINAMMNLEEAQKLPITGIRVNVPTGSINPAQSIDHIMFFACEHIIFAQQLTLINPAPSTTYLYFSYICAKYINDECNY